MKSLVSVILVWIDSYMWPKCWTC